MGTSEGSTAVTLETLSTSTGQSSSVRAQAGSLSSSQPPSGYNSSTEGMPLLEAQDTTTEFGGGDAREQEATDDTPIADESGIGSVNLSSTQEELEGELEDKYLDV